MIWYISMKNTNRGFTLIELMITVAILSVIVAIAIPSYTGYVKTSKLQEAHNNIGALRIAEEAFFSENNAYFGGINTAAVAANSQGLWAAAAGSEGVVAFNYVVTTTPTSWSVTATGNLAGSPVNGEIINATK